MCPIVWDLVPEPTQPPIAVSRIFCGQISNKQSNKIQVFGFGASMYATKSGGNLCLYKGGIKNIPCYIVKGQRMVPVGKGKWIWMPYRFKVQLFKVIKVFVRN